jgi:integrase/recombinase XerC
MFISVPPAPKVLSREEQERLLEVIAQRGCRRDLALLTLALTTGLRLRELVGLNVGDVTTRSGEVAWKVDLPKKITKGRRGGVAFLSERARVVLRDFLAAKRVMRESMALTAPLFRSSMTRRLSLRRVQVIFARWQREAGFETHYNFHTLRHTAITNVYRATKDLFLTQRFARHASPVTHRCIHPPERRRALRGDRPDLAPRRRTWR